MTFSGIPDSKIQTKSKNPDSPNSKLSKDNIITYFFPNYALTNVRGLLEKRMCGK